MNVWSHKYWLVRNWGTATLRTSSLALYTQAFRFANSYPLFVLLSAQNHRVNSKYHFCKIPQCQNPLFVNADSQQLRPFVRLECSLLLSVASRTFRLHHTVVVSLISVRDAVTALVQSFHFTGALWSGRNSSGFGNAAFHR